jgi:glycosyltransferase involved in cell wall biosynthesis
MDKKTLSVAILGTRGVPNRYGGFEACAAELGTGLAGRGHKVTIYAASDHPFKDEYWRGTRRVTMPNPERWLGSAGQFIYDFHCNRHAKHENFDIILHLGYTSDSIWYRGWAKKSIHIVNMDGQEWKRSKYNRAVRAFLLRAERMATLRATYLVADSRQIEKELLEKYSVPVRYIAYGAKVPGSYSADLLDEWGLARKKYDLIIARMEPENNIEIAIKAKITSVDRHPLVIIGNANRHKRYLEKKYGHHDLIRFLDAIYDEDKINSLRHFSRIYVHGHSVGGTNPSLLEAMACGCRIVAHNNPFNGSVLGESAFYYSGAAELASYFSSFDPAAFDSLIKQNLEKIRKEYNWEAVTDAYEKLFFDASGHP